MDFIPWLGAGFMVFFLGYLLGLFNSTHINDHEEVLYWFTKNVTEISGMSGEERRKVLSDLKTAERLAGQARYIGKQEVARRIEEEIAEIFWGSVYPLTCCVDKGK